MKKNMTVFGAAVLFSVMMLAGAAWAGDNGNGTITDGGLVWLKNPGCYSGRSWDQAMSAASSLKSGDCGLTDKSTTNQWRLPTTEELQARYSMGTGAFTGVKKDNYWSNQGEGEIAWNVSMRFGYVTNNG